MPSFAVTAEPPVLGPRSPQVAAASRAAARADAHAPAGTIFEALREQHAEQRALCTAVSRSRPSDPQRRHRLLRDLRISLAAHAGAEERYLYVPILMSDAGLDPARHALGEHHEIDELVEDLLALEPSGTAWGEQAQALTARVRHHLKEEESRFFQVSGKILTDRQKTRLAQQYRRDYARLVQQLSGRHATGG